VLKIWRVFPVLIIVGKSNLGQQTLPYLIFQTVALNELEIKLKGALKQSSKQTC
jgi:hypothetical protein